MHNNRILIVTPGKSIFTGPFTRAFERAGYICKGFDHRGSIVFRNVILRKIFHKLPIMKFLKRKAIKRINQQLLITVQEFRPCYLFCQKGESIFPETIIKIRQQGIVTINFYNDFINQWEVIKAIAPSYDYFLSPDHYVLKKLGELGLKNCFYLPLAVEIASSNSSLNNKEVYDISFIGTYDPKLYPNREKFLVSIRNMRLYIWGNDAWKRSALKNNYQGRAPFEERFDIYGKSKIVIDINWDTMPCEAVNLRPFEIGYAGACLFSDTTRADLFRIFDPYKDFIPFFDENDLYQKIKYYLEHESERVTVARSCHEKIMRNHTYDVRIKQIFNIMNTNLYPS